MIIQSSFLIIIKNEKHLRRDCRTGELGGLGCSKKSVSLAPTMRWYWPCKVHNACFLIKKGAAFCHPFKSTDDSTWRKAAL